MKKAVSISELREARHALPSPVGLVPTMGYLHEGHLSLVRAAKESCASVVVSIFVNPAQFGPAEDLSRYPRDILRDLNLLAGENVNLVWLPEPEVMYPPDFQTWIDVEKVAKPLEGVYRPGHFRGVATVVAKLFNAVQPDRAYFGQKDAQQAAVLRQMVIDLNFNLEIVLCPTVREPDGLSMSSRNIYLDPQQRAAAVVLYRSLRLAEANFQAGETNAEKLRLLVSRTVETEPLAALQYISCCNPETLEELQGEVPRGSLLCLSVLFGSTRLIDNLILGG
jgi:pantoate--beta-alanine ligase